MISHQTNESTISSCATPAKMVGSDIAEGMPESGSRASAPSQFREMSGARSSFGQFNCRFWRVLKWPSRGRTARDLREFSQLLRRQQA